MKSKAIWIAGVAALGVMSAAGLHYVLPDMEKDIRAKVDKVMALNGMDDVKATVSGQTVTLTAMDADPDAAQKLKAAQDAIARIKDPDQPDLPGGQVVNGMVTKIDVIVPTAPSVGGVSKLAGATASANGPEVPPAIIDGEKATSIDTSVSSTPPVAGEDAPLSRVAAQACEEKIYKALKGRKVDYIPGTYALTEDSEAVLDDVYSTVASCPATMKVKIIGYSDNAGDAMAARLITQARAQAAADGLIKRGLARNRISVDGQGATRPVASNATPEGRAANRRVVFEVSEQPQVTAQN